MDMLQTKGIFLPTFGTGKLSLDTRTGFYILPQVIPRGLTVPLPAEGTQPYKFLAMPLDTPEAKKRAMTYILMFRNVVPAKFMDKYGLDKGFGIRRAMAFDRPPVLPRVFDELGLEVPRSFKDGIARAAKLFQGEKAGAKPMPLGKPVPALSLAKPEEEFPNYGGTAGTPPFGMTPPFGATPTSTPPSMTPNSEAMKEAIRNLRLGVDLETIVRGGYGRKSLTDKEKEELRKMTPTSPVYRPSTPTPLTGGTRKVSKRKKGTRKRKNTLEDIAKLFSKIWIHKKV
jgi:hypothetical protein